MDRRAYLDRIRYDAPTAPTVETLHGIYAAHLLTVPFENLDIVPLSRPIRLEPEALFDKIVRRRRGGFCYELNGLLSVLLRDLGYEATILTAQWPRDDGSLSPIFDHMVLLVQPPASDERWLVDVGAGRSSPARPLRLDLAGEQYVPESGLSYQFEVDGEYWRLLSREAKPNVPAHVTPSTGPSTQPIVIPSEVERSGSDVQAAIQRQILRQAQDDGGGGPPDDGDAWSHVYSFTLIPRQHVDFVQRCYELQTSPDSHFTQGMLCSLATPAGRITLSKDRLITTSNGTRDEQEIRDDQEIQAVLRTHFGIDLDHPSPITAAQRAPGPSPTGKEGRSA